MEHRTLEYALSDRGGRRSDGRAGRPPEAQVGVRVRRRRHRVRGADCAQWHDVRGERQRHHPRDRCSVRLPPLGLSGEWPCALGAARRGGWPAADARLRRPDRVGLRARCTHGARSVEDPDRGARSHEADRVPGGAQRPRVHSRGVVGGDPRDRPQVSLLHVPRQRHRAARRRRVARLEDLHGRFAKAHGCDQFRYGDFRAVGRRHLGHADRRCQARRALRGNWRQLFLSGHQDERRGDRPQARQRSYRLVAADDAERRLQLVVRRPRDGERPDAHDRDR